MPNVLILFIPSLRVWSEKARFFGGIDLVTGVAKGYGQGIKVSTEVLFPGLKSLSASAQLNRKNMLRRLCDGEFDGVIITGDANHHFIPSVLDAIKASKTALVNKADPGSVLDDTLQGFVRLAGGGIRV